MRRTRELIASLALIALAAPAAWAQPAGAVETEADAGAWSFGVAPRVGLTVPTSELGPMVVGGLAIDYVLPLEIPGALAVALDGSITRPGHSGTVSDDRIGGAGDYDIDVTEFKVGLDVIYRLFGPDARLVPWVGGGPILHMLQTTETTSFAPGDNTAQDTNIGFEMVAGADFRVGPGLVLGEARLLGSNLNHLFTGNSNAGNVMVSAGYRFVF